ncbi:hypothetical protein [Streptomyces sp. MMBL 11-3]|uniref:hypothetical protein n=1 Tax=Streptomyces sp. MMBL 11-3 TaxID=3382639 RepID=UPI0039B45909
MTKRDEGGSPAVFARAPDASWPDDGSDCRWCRILLGPVSAVGSSTAQGVRRWRSERRAERRAGWNVGGRTDSTRTWLERVRPVILPLAALTVLAALALAVLG